MENKLKLTFSVTRIAHRQYRITYSALCPECNINITDGEFVYRPVFEFKDKAEAEVGAMKCLRNMVGRVWDYKGSVIFTCEGVDMNGFVPTPVTEALPQANTSERIYEVVLRGGVWTIVKRDTPYLTEEQAKTELLKHIQNKD